MIHPDGTLQLTDRTKDVIKSGGEWISSVELENAAMSHPGGGRGRGDRHLSPQVGRAPDPGGGQKARGGGCGAKRSWRISPQTVAKWWLPDAVEFVAEIPA